MIKKTIILLAIIFSFFVNVHPVFALSINSPCLLSDPSPNHGCDQGLSCQPTKANPKAYACDKDIFGQIEAPDPLKGLVNKDPTGAGGLSIFFSNLVALIYVIATIVLILMIVWGAWDWLTSEGDKEKLQGAQRKLINAVIGIMLFAAAFAVIQMLGTFTGFQFFVGQK